VRRVALVTALPSRTFAVTLLACLLAVVISGTAVVTATTTAEPTTRLTTATQSTTQLTAADAQSTLDTQSTTGAQSTTDARPCIDDEYRPPDLDSEWDQEFVDSLENTSRANWAGGQVVRVGATGDCSLAVLDGESATLTATSVDGTRGVLTGTLDLGANGSLALVATNDSTSSGPSTDASTTTGSEAAVGEADTTGTSAVASTAATTAATPTVIPATGERSVSNRSASALVLSNDGPDFASSVVVETGNRSTRVALPTGRFFHFAVRLDGGTTRVALWDADEAWDGQWDVRLANATGDVDWEVRLGGRAFLDGVGVGVGETGEGPSSGETGEPDGTPTGDGPDDDPFPDDGFEPEEISNDGQGPDESGDGRAFLGFFLVVIGVVGFRYARGITRFGEQMDSIGSKTRMSEVEAADWNVALTKIGSALAALIGAGMIVGAVL
jgi:hypothetical protein